VASTGEEPRQGCPPAPSTENCKIHTVSLIYLEINGKYSRLRREGGICTVASLKIGAYNTNWRQSLMKTDLHDLKKAELVDLQRLAYLLKSLSPAEAETLELLLDDEAQKTIQASLKELDEGKGLPVDEW